MISTHRHIQELVALLKLHNIRKIVICPGSRNIAFIKSVVEDFQCYSITDERSAAFFALGMALQSGETVAISCTSGSALLNLQAGLAEAVEQKVPLLILSSDRPREWIGQNEDQTIEQVDIYKSLKIKTYNLFDIYNPSQLWHCNRLINEALLELDEAKCVHINIPTSEPIFTTQDDIDFTPRHITKHHSQSFSLPQELLDDIKKYEKIILLLGQRQKDEIYNSEILNNKFVVLADHISNLSHSIWNYEQILSCQNDNSELLPQLLISTGGHITSKRLKKLLRDNKIIKHWYIGDEIKDLFCSITDICDIPIDIFLDQLSQIDIQKSSFIDTWKSKSIVAECDEYGSIYAIREFTKHIPPQSILHLGNSNSVRIALNCPLDKSIKVLCNRGLSGIEGSLSTAIGYACESKALNMIIIGDLSFFYDNNALWNKYQGTNIRIMLINNNRGEIFQTLAGLDLSDSSADYILAHHRQSAKDIANSHNYDYLAVYDKKSLEKAIDKLCNKDSLRPILTEVFVDADTDSQLIKDFYKNLKIYEQ